MNTDKIAALGATTTRGDYDFFLIYTETTVQDLAKLAGISVIKTAAITEGLEASMGDAEVVARLGLTVPDYFAVWSAFEDVIQRRAVPRMVAYAKAHPNSPNDPDALGALEIANR